METTRIIKGNKYTFDNQSFSNYRNWGHKTDLYKNGIYLNSNKSIYINRTWESYQYQSCMINCVYKLIEGLKAQLKEEYKQINNVIRMSSKHKKIFEDQLLNNNVYLELKELKNTL